MDKKLVKILTEELRLFAKSHPRVVGKIAERISADGYIDVGEEFNEIFKKIAKELGYEKVL